MGGAVIGYYDSGIKMRLVRGDGTLINNTYIISTNPDAWIEKIFTGNNELTLVYSIEDENTETTDFYIQRYDDQGAPVFSGSGVKVISTTWEPEVDVDNEWIISDGQGGFFVLVMEEDVNNKIRLQHVSKQGVLSFSGYGLVIDEATYGDAAIASDNAGGVVVAWTDIRNATDVGLYAQKFSATGSKVWAEDVALLTSGAGDITSTISLAKTDDGNFVFVIPGATSGGANNLLLGQKVSSSGVLQWPATGVIISNATGLKSDPSITESNGNIIVAWSDRRNGNDLDVYAHSLSPSGVLPVHLTKFEAEYRNQNVLIVWETANEINNDYFEIERSADGKVFETLSRVKAKGDLNRSISYKYTDFAVPTVQEELYYRLKQVDNDGKFTYSNVEIVKIEQLQKLTFNIYPNPTTDKVTLKLSDEAVHEGYYRLVDLQGKELLRGNILTKHFDVNLSGYPAGIYVMEVKDRKGTISSKIVKQ